MKKVFCLTLFLLSFCGIVRAQVDGLEGIEWRRVERDALPPAIDSMLMGEYVPPYQPTDDIYRVATNRFWNNWWMSLDVGLHTFQGDHSGDGRFRETLSPDFNFSVGKWFTPGFGIKGQIGLGDSRGFTEIWTPYATGSKDAPMMTDNGTPFWTLRTRWIDYNANVVFNLSRIFSGYEGYGSDELMNQFYLTVGIGGVHHYDEELKNTDWGYPYYGPKNEWYGNLELQYSRFFNEKKAWSLDVKLRGRFYETHFDLSPLAGKRWDINAGLSLGATYYFRARGWERCVPVKDVTYFISVPAPVIVAGDCPEYRTFTFYIFYPNNYSGRNDAPVVADADVNSMDYLAGGIFTQRRFVSDDAVAARLASGASLRQLRTENIPTVAATFTENPAGIPRGYEMSDMPISLSMDAADLRAFRDAEGYYYAPVYDGARTWYYRIDDETKTQSLLSRDNYTERTSYCLNAHAGLETVGEHMPVEDGSDLYSFADVYAALVGDEGHVAEYADRETVETIRNILENGTIIHVQAEGLATSQDNYTGRDAEAVGLARNRTLSYFRALSAITWLRESGRFEGLKPGDFSINIFSEPIGRVDDASVQGLNAKLNRCARVTVKYMIEK